MSDITKVKLLEKLAYSRIRQVDLDGLTRFIKLPKKKMYGVGLIAFKPQNSSVSKKRKKKK